jgi:hypothetical protein
MAADRMSDAERQSDVPETLYKYVRRSGLRLLEERLLRVPSPIGFNDPFEILPGLEALLPADRLAALLSHTVDGEEIEEIYEETARGRGVPSSEIRRELPPDELRARFESDGMGGIVEDLAPGLYRVVQKAISEHLGIVCFTDRPDSLLMWSHYAEGHRGFVYGFDPRHPFFQPEEGSDRLFRKVAYSRRRPRVVLSDARAPSDVFSERVAHEFLFTKSEEWAYESEWRLVLPVDPDESVDGEPHVRLPEGLLTTIVVGSRASEEDRARVAELTADEFFRDVEVLQASVSGEEFRIDLAPLNGT